MSLVTSEQAKGVRRMQRELDIDEPIGEPDLGAILDIEPAPPKAEKPERRDTARQARDKRTTPAKQRGDSVYVANLPWTVTEDELHRLFARHGRVHQTTIIINKRSGRSKGYGFVDMPRQAAKTAVEALHGTTLGGRDLTVRIAQPRRYGG